MSGSDPPGTYVASRIQPQPIPIGGRRCVGGSKRHDNKFVLADTRHDDTTCHLDSRFVFQNANHAWSSWPICCNDDGVRGARSPAAAARQSAAP